MLDSTIIEKIEENVSSIIKSDDTEDTKIFNLIDYIEETVSNLITTQVQNEISVELYGKNHKFIIGEIVIFNPSLSAKGVVGRVIDKCTTFASCLSLNVDGDTERYNSCHMKHVIRITPDLIKGLLELNH